MAKNNRVTVMINGRSRTIDKRALSMAEKHFGAVLLDVKDIAPPYELKSIPQMQKPKIIAPPVMKAPPAVETPKAVEVPKEEITVKEAVAEFKAAKKTRKAPVKSKAK